MSKFFSLTWLLFLLVVPSSSLAASSYVPFDSNIDWDGKKNYRVYQYDKNYVDDQGLWNEANPVWDLVNDKYEVRDAPYEYVLPAVADQISIFVPKKRSKDSLGTPYQIGDSFIFTRQWHGMNNGVMGTLDGYSVVYSDVFKDFNADLIVTPSADRVSHVIKIWSKPAKDVEFCFDIENDSFTLKDERSFSLKKGDFGIQIAPVKAWSKGLKPKEIGARLYAKETKAGLVTICKQLSVSAFDSLGDAPYYFDDIFFPDPDGGNYADGYTYETDSTWSNARGGVGEGADDNSTTGIARVYGAVGNYQNYRGGFVFDTSAISPMLVSSGALKVKVADIYDNDNDAQAYMIVSGFSPATDANLVAGDYDSMDFIAYSSAIDITGLVDEAYFSLPLLTAGKNYINTSGTTAFSLLEGHDFENISVDTTGNNGINFYAADTTGTSSDPYLELELESAGGGSGTGTVFGSGTTLSGSLLPFFTQECVETMAVSGTVLCTQWDNYLLADSVQFSMRFLMYVLLAFVVTSFVIIVVFYFIKSIFTWFFKTLLSRK